VINDDGLSDTLTGGVTVVAPALPPDDGANDGCGCAATRTDAGAGALLLIVLGLFLVRRRRVGISRRSR
jgi:MYXO-CTERM domain-containing protein